MGPRSTEYGKQSTKYSHEGDRSVEFARVGAAERQLAVCHAKIVRRLERDAEDLRRDEPQRERVVSDGGHSREEFCRALGEVNRTESVGDRL